MTTFEHAMLGINGTLAVGLHRKHGWQITVMAALVAILPDWDGLSLLFGAAAFDESHRVWGHNLLVASVLAVAVAGLDWRLGIIDHACRRLARWVPGLSTGPLPRKRSRSTGPNFVTWSATAVLAAYSHLAVDLVYSGHAELGNWQLELLWPFSRRGWAYPLVPWGDVGATVIFVAGMFALLRWPPRSQSIAGTTLAAVAGYIVVRGMIGL